MIGIFFNVLLSFPLAFTALWYMYHFMSDGNENEKAKPAVILRSNIVFTVITAVFFLGYTVFASVFAYINYYNNISLLRNLFFLYSLYLMSATDIKKRIIPNRIIIADIIIRALFLIAEIFWISDDPLFTIETTGIGFIISLIVALVLLLISRGKLGGGDVKLIAIIGLYTGSANVFTVIFSSFFFCAVYGTILLVSKKRKASDTVPFAPFVFAGMLFYLTLMYLTVNN